MSYQNFVFSWVEHDKSFITSRPVCCLHIPRKSLRRWWILPLPCSSLGRQLRRWWHLLLPWRQLTFRLRRHLRRLSINGVAHEILDSTYHICGKASFKTSMLKYPVRYMGESSKLPKSWTFETPILKLAVCLLNIHNIKFKWSIVFWQIVYR